MPHASFAIKINEEEASDIYENLLHLEVELCDDSPASFVMRLGMPLEVDGSWRFLDDERFRIWSKVTIQAGYDEGSLEDLMIGYITQVKPTFNPDESSSTLELSGQDASVLMDREEKLKDWPGKKDSDIATAIIGQYGLSSVVQDTTIIHDEALSTIIQRETDYQFLKRLALRNGLDCFVENNTAFFQPTPIESTPQPILAANFGDETNLCYFKATVDALQPANVSMFQIDRFNKEELSTEVSVSDTPALGSLNAAALLPQGVEPGHVFVAKNAATGLPEMEALCQGLFQEGAWLVRGEGEIESAQYGHILKPRRLVTIKGIGRTFSGVYYVSFTKHTFSRDGYAQFFRVKRDGILPTGDEDFSADDGLLGGLL